MGAGAIRPTAKCLVPGQIQSQFGFYCFLRSGKEWQYIKLMSISSVLPSFPLLTCLFTLSSHRHHCHTHICQGNLTPHIPVPYGERYREQAYWTQQQQNRESAIKITCWMRVLYINTNTCQQQVQLIIRDARSPIIPAVGKETLSAKQNVYSAHNIRL